MAAALNLGLAMTDQEKRKAIEAIAREAKRLEELASQNGEDFLAFLLANVRQETTRILAEHYQV